MDIISRNLFRLLRSGAFQTEERIEPMSACKWQKAYRLSLLHGVEDVAYSGYRRLDSQFFMHLTDDLEQQWQQQARQHREPPRESRWPANRPLARRLRKIREQAGGAGATSQVLDQTVSVAQCLLTADRWVKQLLGLARMLEHGGHDIDRNLLADWSRQLQMTRMLQLEGALLTSLLGVERQLLPFEPAAGEDQTRQMVEEVVAHLADTRHQWHFSQGHGIFVHTSNAQAMFWQARQSAHYLRYFPSESVATFFASFLQSLTNIEE